MQIHTSLLDQIDHNRKGMLFCFTKSRAQYPNVVFSLGVLSLLLSAVRKQLAGKVLHVLCFLVFLVLIFESM